LETGTTLKARPWYEHLEPWLLLAAPMAAIAAGVITWWLAATANNSLVVDDYYRQGKAINQTLARDDQARRLGLSAELLTDPLRNELTLRLTAGASDAPLPDALRLRLVHATRAELDQQIRLRRGDDGRWHAAFAVPAPTRWQVHIEDEGGAWRLVRQVDSFAQIIAFGLASDARPDRSTH